MYYIYVPSVRLYKCPYSQVTDTVIIYFFVVVVLFYFFWKKGSGVKGEGFVWMKVKYLSGTDILRSFVLLSFSHISISTCISVLIKLNVLAPEIGRCVV